MSTRKSDSTEIVDCDENARPIVDMDSNDNAATVVDDMNTPPAWPNPSEADYLTTLALIVPVHEWAGCPFNHPNDYGYTADPIDRHREVPVECHK